MSFENFLKELRSVFGKAEVVDFGGEDVNVMLEDKCFTSADIHDIMKIAEDNGVLIAFYSVSASMKRNYVILLLIIPKNGVMKVGEALTQTM